MRDIKTILQSGNKYVPNSSAQINHLCNGAPGLKLDKSSLGYSEDVKDYPKSYLDVIINLQSDYGLRISEVLAIKGSDISKKGLIKIKGLKGSENRIIVPSNYKLWWLSKIGINLPVFDGISRFAVYRAYKKLGIELQVPGRKKMSVTHAFRHIIINDIRKIANNEKDIQRFTGHKSEKNSKIYGQTRNTDSISKTRNPNSE